MFSVLTDASAASDFETPQAQESSVEPHDLEIGQCVPILLFLTRRNSGRGNTHIVSTMASMTIMPRAMRVRERTSGDYCCSRSCRGAARGGTGFVGAGEAVDTRAGGKYRCP